VQEEDADVCGSRPASGCRDGSIKVWGMGAGAAWAREASLFGHTGGARSLAGWQDKAALSMQGRRCGRWRTRTDGGPPLEVPQCLAVSGSKLVGSGSWSLGAFRLVDCMGGCGCGVRGGRP
jgi:hypothetical protein